MMTIMTSMITVTTGDVKFIFVNIITTIMKLLMTIKRIRNKNVQKQI